MLMNAICKIPCRYSYFKLALHYSTPVTFYIILLFQLNHSDATKTQVAELSHKWMAVILLSQATTDEESTPS